jgi:hypothetical protein
MVMVPMRPETIRKTHFAERKFNQAGALPSIQVKAQKIDTPNASFG